MKRKMCKRLLSFVMMFSMIIALAVPSRAAEDTSNSNSVSFEKVDDSAVSAPLSWREAAQEDSDADAYYSDTDVVRVSIVLEDPSTIEAGYSTTDIASNRFAMAYRSRLQREQNAVTSSIEKTTRDGLDVVWNLTLAANVISANVEYGQIEAILATPGVADVVIETCYEPAVVVTDEADDPSMSTSSSMIGSSVAYLEGYTGAGTRIAIIDTGIDTDHQSFDAGAYEYALGVLAEKAELDAEEYAAGLNLLTADEVASVADHLNVKVDTDQTYLSSKVPYAYNYVDDDYDVTHDNDTQTEHGSHVAGIAAANSYIPNGDGTYASAIDTVLTQGVAPEAQLIIMKVFGKNGGAYDSDYMAAIEDAIILGADSVNLSLGSANAGFSRSSSEYYQSILDSLTETDTVVCMSAGNSYSWVENAENLGYLYLDDVSLDTVGSPGSYTNSLSVASADNTGYTGAYLTIDGTTVFYTETTGYANAPMTTIAGEQEYVYIDGFGTEEEFAALADVLNGKIAVCSRGVISFYQKGDAAAGNGAIATIVYNNQEGTIAMDLSDYSYSAPCVSVTQAEGALLKAAAEPVTDDEGNVLYYLGTLNVSNGVGAANDTDADITMSDFSSWGVPGSLKMKPEITAPGGSIYSVNGAVEGGTAYENMSGTSMAAPQVTGMAALLVQYIRENGLDEKTGVSSRVLSQSLLMSTAEPLFEAESGYGYYSILKQGAGLANVGAAVTATSYILMSEDATDSYADGKVKAELGEDADREGVYSFSFTINNLTDTEEAYDLSADLFTQDMFPYYVNNEGDIGYYMDTWTADLACDVAWNVDGKTLAVTDELNGRDFNGDGLVNAGDGQALLDYATGARDSLYHTDMADLNDDGEINSYDSYLFFRALNAGYAVVPANGSVTVTVTLALTEEQKDELDMYYTAGAYIEGFVYATALTSEEGVLGTSHSIPVLGYYGSWSDPSMYDVGSWTEYSSGEEYRLNYLGSNYSNYVTVKYTGEDGAYYFGGNPIFEEEYDETRNAINSENGDAIYKINFALIRNAEAGVLTVTNTTAGEIEYGLSFGETVSAYYHVNGGQWRNTSYSSTLNYVPEGEEGDAYELSLTMIPEYYVDEEGNADWDALGDGVTLSIPFTIDNTAPAVSGITGQNLHNEEGNKVLEITASDNQYIAGALLYTNDGSELLGAFPGEQSKAGEDWTFTVDASEMDGGVYLLQVYDYAMNCASYRVFLDTEETTEVESLTLSQDSLTLIKGGKAVLTAEVLPVTLSDPSVTWTSDDENIATVSADGVVTGVNEGKCTIVATSNQDPTVSAECAVTVITIKADLNAILWDEEGEVWWTAFNTSDPGSYTKLTDESASAGIWSAAIQDGTLYAQDENQVLYSVDPSSYELTAIGSGQLEYTDMAETYSLDGYLLAVYGPYVVFVDPTTGDYAGAWNYGVTLTGITYVGSVFNTYYQTYIDLYYLIDIDGNVYLDAYIALNGAYYYFYGTEKAVTATGITAAAYYYNSAYYDFDSEYLYYSVWDGSTNTIYAIDDMTGAAYELGDFGQGVWPVSGLLKLDVPEEASANDSLGSDLSQAQVQQEAEMKVEEPAVEEPAVEETTEDETDALPAGGLNSVKAAAQGSETERLDIVPASAGEVTVTVTAKDDNGEEVASTNGVATITYDPAILRLVNVTVNANYSSEVREDGSVTIGYVSLSGIEAGDAVATLEFDYVEPCSDTEVVIRHREIGSQMVDYSENSALEAVSDHSCEEPVFNWADDYSSCTAVYTCSVCGESQKVPCTVISKAVNETATEDGFRVYIATVVIGGKTYKSTRSVTIPATGSNAGVSAGTATGDMAVPAVWAAVSLMALTCLAVLAIRSRKRCR